MPCTAAKKERTVMILNEIETTAGFLIYVAGGCKFVYPKIGTIEYSEFWGEAVPPLIGWAAFLTCFFLFGFEASKTVRFTSTTVSIAYLGRILSRQYKWEEILYWGKWENSQKKQYVYLSVRRPHHHLFFIEWKQCHLPYSEELYALVALLAIGSASVDPNAARMTEAELEQNRKKYYRIRFTGASISALFSLIVMLSDSFAVVCAALVLGMMVWVIYAKNSEPVLSKLDAAYYNDFMGYHLSRLQEQNT